MVALERDDVTRCKIKCCRTGHSSERIKGGEFRLKLYYILYLILLFIDIVQWGARRKGISKWIKSYVNMNNYCWHRLIKKVVDFKTALWISSFGVIQSVPPLWCVCVNVCIRVDP